MATYEILQGDCLTRLRELPADWFHCVVTSPPYWGLRDYGVDGQIGLESTLGEYIDTMVKVFREVRRVLHPTGMLWLNLGDAYNRKQLVGLPWRVAFALQADGWWLRQDIVWHKPNPMPESVSDRFTRAHEFVFMLAKSRRYYFDMHATRQAASRRAPGNMRPGKSRRKGAGGYQNRRALLVQSAGAVDSAKLRDVWSIVNAPFPGAHFATYPAKLVERCILSATSPEGCCSKCGIPMKRVVERTRVPTRPGARSKCIVDGCRIEGLGVGNRAPKRHITSYRTVGWEPGCECGAEKVPCRVLDPFCGSGTTGVVAAKLGCDFTGIELNPDYYCMAERRVAEAYTKHKVLWIL